MPAISASAPGKIILFGEHAVVYGQPAIAAPLGQVRSRVVIEPVLKGKTGQVFFHAPDIDVSADMDSLEEENPFRAGVNLVLSELSIDRMPACKIQVSSTIPIASGLGSSASISAALIRAIAKFLGHPFENEIVNRLAFEMEKLHHGIPSGVDNTVVVFDTPVFFIRGKGLQRFILKKPIRFLVADSGIRASTARVVGDVRKRWVEEPERYDEIFTKIGKISHQARKHLEEGDIDVIGGLMIQNQELLVKMGVSCDKLDELVSAARRAGASGAKLSGGGRGGNMIALVTNQTAAAVEAALLKVGATRVINTIVEATNDK